MGQMEIFQILKKNKNKWFTTRDIAKNLGRTRNAVTPTIRRLLKLDDVIRKKKTGREYEYSYQPNKKDRRD